MFDPYKILGIQNDATEKQIKSAYRAVSVQHHPDRGGDVDLFHNCTRAKDILLDNEMRNAYDVGGWARVEQLEERRLAAEQHRRDRTIKKCPEIVVDVDITLAQIFGKENIPIVCTVPIQDNSGNKISQKEFKAEVPANVGMCSIPLKGIERPNHITGDIIIRFNVDDDTFDVQDLHIIYTAKLGLGELIDGYCINIVHPNGKTYTVQGKYNNDDNDDGDVLVFRGLGIERGKDTGDLIIKFTLDLTVQEDKRAAVLKILGYNKPCPTGQIIAGMTVQQLQEQRVRQMQGMRSPWGGPHIQECVHQ